MATKKKGNKAAGTKVVRKGKPSSGNKIKASKGVTKAKAPKGKKAPTPKKSKAKTIKFTPGKKPKSPASSKKKTTTKKTTVAPTNVKKKKMATSKAKVVKKVAVSKVKTKKKVALSKLLPAKKKVASKKKAPAKAKAASKKVSPLSPQECYNVGGLCACVIETFTKDGQGRLQRVLKHLGLSGMDQANLYRVSQGLRIPKLFADGLAGEESRRGALQTLSQFAKADDPSGKRWKSDIEDMARLLGD